MRILIIGDSHGLGMQSELYNLDQEHLIYNLSLSGGRASTLRVRAAREMPQIRRFDPQVALVHLGHNSVAYHSDKNPHPIGGS